MVLVCIFMVAGRLTFVAGLVLLYVEVVDEA